MSEHTPGPWKKGNWSNNGNLHIMATGFRDESSADACNTPARVYAPRRQHDDECIFCSPNDITEADANAWFDANQNRVRGRTLEQLSQQIKTFLNTENQTKVEAAFLDMLKKKTQVSLMLQPPRRKVTVLENDPSKGPKDAPVLIVEYSDFQ